MEPDRIPTVKKWLLLITAILTEVSATLSLRAAELLVESAIDECERFYPVFQFVLWGGKTPKEALAAAMTETQGEA